MDVRALDVLLKVTNRAHKAVLKLSGGRVGYHVAGMAAVELHTTGRRSGQRRSSMLTSPIWSPDRFVLVASKGGDDRHPEWYLNLTADPEVELTFEGSTRRFQAHTATPDERAALWPEITARHPHYAGYQRRTSREIPLVICTLTTSVDV